MATSEPMRNSHRMFLARQLMADGCFRQLMVLSRRDGMLEVEPFQQETAATVFVDTPLALIRGDIAGSRFFETVNAIQTFDEIVAYLRDSGATEVDGCGDVRVMKIMVGNCAILEI